MELFENIVWGIVYIWLGLCVYAVAEVAYDLVWDFLSDCLTSVKKGV